MECRRFRATVAYLNPNEDVIGIELRKFDLDIPVPVLIEDSRIEELVFGIELSAPPVLFDELSVWECSLRVLVEHPHVGMGWGAVEVVVKLLDIFSVVALGSS